MLTCFELLRDLADASQPRFSELVALTKRGSPAPVVAAPKSTAPIAVGSALAQELASLGPAERQAHTESAVLRVVRELTGADGDAIVASTPLMEAGVDSLAATELSSRLRSLTGMSLSPTIVFEHPTPRAVATLGGLFASACVGLGSLWCNFA